MATMQERHFATLDDVLDYMRGHTMDGRLAHGVGNDMSYSFYTHREMSRICFWPTGIDGHPEYLTWEKED